MADIEKLPAGSCAVQELFTQASLAKTVGAPIAGKVFECSFAGEGGQGCSAIGVLNEDLHTVAAD